MNGIIKSYNSEKGFGFIKGSNNDNYFFHISDVSDGLPMQGVQVSFVEGHNNKGLKAVDVIVSSSLNRSPSMIDLFGTKILLSDIRSYELKHYVRQVAIDPELRTFEEQLKYYDSLTKERKEIAANYLLTLKAIHKSTNLQGDKIEIENKMRINVEKYINSLKKEVNKVEKKSSFFKIIISGLNASTGLFPQDLRELDIIEQIRFKKYGKINYVNLTIYLKSYTIKEKTRVYDEVAYHADENTSKYAEILKINQQLDKYFL